MTAALYCRRRKELEAGTLTNLRLEIYFSPPPSTDLTCDLTSDTIPKVLQSRDVCIDSGTRVEMLMVILCCSEGIMVPISVSLSSSAVYR